MTEQERRDVDILRASDMYSTWAKAIDAAVEIAQDHHCQKDYGLCDCQGYIVKAIGTLRGKGSTL